MPGPYRPYRFKKFRRADLLARGIANRSRLRRYFTKWKLRNKLAKYTMPRMISKAIDYKLYPGLGKTLKVSKGQSTSVFPQRVEVILNYFDNERMVPTNTTQYQEFVLSMNSLFDPDEQTGGHQPRGFDQWKTYYGNYLVKECKYVVEIYAPYVTSMANNLMAGVDVGTTFSDLSYNSVNDFMEQAKTQYHKYKHITAQGVNSSQTGIMDRACFMGTVNIERLVRKFGPVNRSTSTVFKYPEDFAAAISADPTANLQLTVAVGSLLDTGSAVLNMPNVYVNYRLSYKVEFFNLLEPAQS